jgi:hypothetical protein
MPALEDLKGIENLRRLPGIEPLLILNNEGYLLSLGHLEHLLSRLAAVPCVRPFDLILTIVRDSFHCPSRSSKRDSVWLRAGRFPAVFCFWFRVDYVG